MDTESPKTVVINGSARIDSNTEKAIEELCPFLSYEEIYLLDFDIAHYHYDSLLTDDFIKIVNLMLKADNIVFATPVYWYSMSGRMKVFFDRLTDLVTTNKSLGRNLKGKDTYLICNGSENQIPQGFEVPFAETSKYFDMNFKQSFYKKF